MRSGALLLPKYAGNGVAVYMVEESRFDRTVVHIYIEVGVCCVCVGSLTRGTELRCAERTESPELTQCLN